MRMISILGAMSLSAAAAGQPGRATAGWIASSPSCEPGAPLHTAIRLVVEHGWHTYWVNPGAAGMKPAVEWQLPDGWTTSGLSFPVPQRFVTGGLSGFGYEGTVLFPVTVTPPAEFEGEVTLTARLTWLACNDSGCVPGEARLSLVLKSGPPSPSADAAAVRAALRKIPRVEDTALRLSVVEKPAALELSIEPLAGAVVDLSRHEAFPVTPEVIDPAAEIRFTQQRGVWISEVPKSEYAATPVKRLSLVLAGKAGESPVQLEWNAP